MSFSRIPNSSSILHIGESIGPSKNVMADRQVTGNASIGGRQSQSAAQNVRMCSYVVCLFWLLVGITISLLLEGNVNAWKKAEVPINQNYGVYGASCSNKVSHNQYVFNQLIFLNSNDQQQSTSYNMICILYCPNSGNQNRLRGANNFSDITYHSYISIGQQRNVNNIYRVQYQSYSVANRLCIPMMEYFRINSIDLEVFIKQGDIKNEGLILQFIRHGLDNFYLDFQNNITYFIISFSTAILLNWIFLKFITSCTSFVIILSQAMGHIALVGTAGLFLFNAGTFNTSPFDYPYLGLPTYKLSSHYVNYAIVFFILEGIWILWNILLCLRRQKMMGVMKSLCQFIELEVAHYKVYLSVVCCLMSGCLVVVMVYASAMISNKSYQVNSYQIFGHSPFSLANAFYLYALTILLSFITYLNQQIYKCLYFEQIISEKPFKSFLKNIRYHLSRIAAHSMFPPLRTCIRIGLLAEGKIQKYLRQQQKCCTRIEITKIMNYLLYSDGFMQHYISNSSLTQSQQQNLQLFMKNQHYYSSLKNLKLMLHSIRLAIALFVAFIYYSLITFIQSLRNNVISPQYHILLVIATCYFISAPLTASLSSPIDSLFYFSINNNKHPTKYTILLKYETVVRQFMDKAFQQKNSDQN